MKKQMSVAKKRLIYAVLILIIVACWTIIGFKIKVSIEGPDKAKAETAFPRTSLCPAKNGFCVNFGQDCYSDTLGGKPVNSYCREINSSAGGCGCVSDKINVADLNTKPWANKLVITSNGYLEFFYVERDNLIIYIIDSLDQVRSLLLEQGTKDFDGNGILNKVEVAKGDNPFGEGKLTMESLRASAIPWNQAWSNASY